MKCPQIARSPWLKRCHGWIFPLVALLVLHPLGSGAIAEEPDFSGTGRPSSQSSGSAGSRGDCDFELTPLLPVEEQGGWTTQANPTLWVQVPVELSSVQSVLVMVRDESGTPVYRTRLTELDAPAGIVRLPLPVELSASSPDSESGSFQWMVAMYCDGAGDRPAYATGSIRRVAVEAPSESDLAGKSSPAISNLYVQNRLWYDALTVLGEARLAAPNDPTLREAWQTLLGYPTVGLDAIADEPLVDCCTLPEP